jgi:cysteine synthase A
MRKAIPTSLEALIGNTPTVAVKVPGGPPGAVIAAKLEMMNPMSSVKDRVALWMIRGAEMHGELRPGGMIIEATSGNTGIALAGLAAPKGYACTIVLPDNATVERIRRLKGYGATVVLTPAERGYPGAIEVAAALHAATPGSWFPRQHENPDNPEAHYRTTGPELWQDLAGQVDVFVCGVGTGGTLSGIARYLKERNPLVRIVAVEPERSAVLSGGPPGPHGIPGLNGGFIAPTTDLSVIDEVLTVADAEAVATAQELGRGAGLLVGISSGCAAHAAFSVARRPESAGLVIATLFPDSGEQYLSMREANSSVSASGPESVLVGVAHQD